MVWMRRSTSLAPATGHSLVSSALFFTFTVRYCGVAGYCRILRIRVLKTLRPGSRALSSFSSRSAFACSNDGGAGSDEAEPAVPDGALSLRAAIRL